MRTKAVEETFQAIPVSPGIAIGRVFVFRGRTDRTAIPEDTAISPSAIEDEIKRYRDALEATRAELTELREEIRRQLNTAEAGIFDAHLLIVEDQVLNSEVEKQIRDEAKSADYAFYRVSEHYISVLSKMPDEYLRERAADIRDVANRVFSHLASGGSGRLDTLTDRRIVVASDLAPSETAQLDREKVLGFAIESGSATSHTAILARSMRLPAVTGLPHGLIERLRAADKLIINGFDGKVILNPTSRTEDAYRLKAEEAGRFYSDLRRESALMPETMDGFAVQLAGNLDAVVQTGELKEAGACGIGLFRTEYLFLNREIPPDEEEQYEVYRSLLVATENRPVIVRTLDIGGDKLSAAMHHAPEQNPFLGLRGIRLCLRERRDILRTQLRALLRAGVYGSLRIMLPMVTLAAEVREVREMIRELQQELAREKLEFASSIPVGAMIETPAAALQAEKIAQTVDFFSIGTNDLVQYTMAIDRGNERVSYLYQPAHPVILESIARCVRAARRHHIWVGVCGQMAGEPEYTPLLVGLGVHELSMDSEAIGPVRRVIRALYMHEAETAARQALEAESAEEALAISLKLLRRAAPEIAALLSQ